ncbi:MAG: carboxypeptidase-like regulatory domain-containing protein [Gemmatimonadota bacterium]|nr:carboxypeptidase-like regulatory domain-containing protein [Gemmatimonadota bacterium]
MTRSAARFATVALVFAGWHSASAQALAIGVRNAAVISALPAATVSAVLRVSNLGKESAVLVPRVELPTGWSAPMGSLPFNVAARSADNWIVSLRIPARAPAGQYVIGLSAQDSVSHATLRDSLVIDVRAVKGLELSLTNRPTYAVSGTSYRSSFLLHNLGNVITTVIIRGKSALNGTVAIDTTIMTLGAGASMTIGASVSTETKGQQAQDDVLELSVADCMDSTNTAQASSRVTIVQEANAADPLHHIASQLRLRAAGAAVGVSPYELIGVGALRDGSDDQLSYVVRGSPGAHSQFGDQDEYRIGVRGKDYDARLGDGLYRVSSLSSNGQAGFGGGLDLQRGDLSAGAFMQRFRLQPDSPTERGAYVAGQASGLFAAPRLTLSALDRTGGYLQGRILGTGLTLTPLNAATVELEVAGSNGPLGNGKATSARITGGTDVHYDVGHVGADAPFAGAYRGAKHDYASVSAKLTSDFQLNAALGSHQSTSLNLGLRAPQSFRSSGVTLQYARKYSLEYTTLSRSSSIAMTSLQDAERGVLAHGEQTYGSTRVWGGIGTGYANTYLSGSHAYHELSLGASTNMGMNSFSLYGQTSDGMAVSRGADKVLTIGGDGRFRVGSNTWVTFNGFQTSVPSTGDHNAQLDAGVAQQLSTGATIGLRMRFLANVVDVKGKQLAFLEYTTPLQLPIGHVRVAGRVKGRVVDQETGAGVAGTLVRLGPQAAITDGEGRVAFAGMPNGEYRLSIAQQATQTATIFTGDPTVRIDSTRDAPATFALGVERAGSVTGTIHQMAVARTGIGSAADSLAVAGPLGDVTLALIGVRDTLFAVSNAAGAYRFAEVVSGSYVLKVMTEAQAGTRWEPAEIDVSVKPAAVQQVTFRLVPRRRAVQMIPSDTNPSRK